LVFVYKIQDAFILVYEKKSPPKLYCILKNDFAQYFGAFD